MITIVIIVIIKHIFFNNKKFITANLIGTN